MNNLVLITSAFYTNYGIYSSKERINQTIKTIQSAKKYIPNAFIILIDNSKEEIKKDTSIELKNLLNSVGYYIDNSMDSDIKYFHTNVVNYDIGKNAMEAIGLYKGLIHIANSSDLSNILKNSLRIFKLSGRYQITKEFNFNNFNNDNTKNKFVFKKSQPSWIPIEHTGVTYQLQTRLWSFDSELMFYVINMYKNIIENMIATFNNRMYIDNEHSMAKFIPKELLVEIDKVGVQGNIAPNGMMIID